MQLVLQIFRTRNKIHTKSTDPRAGLRQTYCSDIELFPSRVSCVSVLLRLSRVSCVAVLLRLARVSCVSVLLGLSRVSCVSVLLRLSSAKGRLAGGGTFATGS